LLAAASGLVSRVSGSITSDAITASGSDTVTSAVSGINLGRQLASEQQLGEVGVGGRAIAGEGTEKLLSSAPRLENQYGGSSEDWAKMTTDDYVGPEGHTFATHWYQNALTNEAVEPKVKHLWVEQALK
jgi:hypothetical protein